MGIVGGVGSGKSTVARLAAERWGLLRLDGDAAGHAALREPAVRAALRDRFGDGIFIPDGEVDRSALAARVFGETPEHRAARRDLEAVVHPRIRARFTDAIAAARRDGTPAVLLDAAVLLESGWDDVTDAVVFVEVPLCERRRRVAARGWDAAELARREASQWPTDRKRAACDAVLDNTGSPGVAVDRLGDLLRSLGVRLPSAHPPAVSLP